MTIMTRATVKRSSFLVAASVLALGASGPAAPAQPLDPRTLSFFVTSVGLTGGDLGGLTGADKHCQELAKAAGVTNRTFHAYLSTQPADGKPGVNARDRVGPGPWYNAKGTLIARDVAELHGVNHLTKETALTEKGEIVNGYGDKPNRHDVLTGSKPDGTAFPAGKDMTCNNWTSTTGTAMLGHTDRKGPKEDPPYKSWNSSHPSRGCTLDALKTTGGEGFFYCFAVN